MIPDKHCFGGDRSEKIGHPAPQSNQKPAFTDFLTGLSLRVRLLSLPASEGNGAIRQVGEFTHLLALIHQT